MDNTGRESISELGELGEQVEAGDQELEQIADVIAKLSAPRLLEILRTHGVGGDLIREEVTDYLALQNLDVMRLILSSRRLVSEYGPSHKNEVERRINGDSN